MTTSPIDRESPFDVSELFFSVTDRKGIIRAGNDVFVRVSKHPEDELIGSPHNIIRHPDMPRAAFRLLWDHLLRDLPIAAYVKNMAADGSYYWVMACVVPCGDGFLSVRLKPTSKLLTAAVIPVYAEVRAMEIRMEQAGTPRREVAERSGVRLLEMLADAGFPDYGSFIRMALPQEIRAREEALGRRGERASGARGIAADLRVAGRRLDDVFAGLEGYASANASLGSSADFIHGLADDVRLNATNGLIAASKLTEGGATLGAVAREMSRCASGMATAADAFSGVARPAMGLLHDLDFRISLAKAQLDMATFFADERAASAHDAGTTDRRAQSLEMLLGCLRREVDGLLDALRRLDENFADLAARTDDIGLTLTTLGALHVAGRIEVASVSGSHGFTVLFDQVRHQLERADPHMASLQGATAHVGAARHKEAALRFSISHVAAPAVAAA
jgi:hypothetical protein